MRADYAERYRRLWEEHWWWRSRERFLINAIGRLSLPKQSRILDVGCGDGLFFPSLERFGTVEGLEADGSLLTNSSDTRRITVGHLDETFRPGPVYDLVVMLDVLEHIENDIEALESAWRSLKPGGKIFITVPALPGLWSRHDEINHHFRRYTKSSLNKAMAAAGFQVKTLRFFFGWTVAPLVVRKWLKPPSVSSSLATQDDLVAIPPRLINQALTFLSLADHWVSTRARLPVGSSLAAVGTRAATTAGSESFPIGRVERTRPRRLAGTGGTV